MKNLIKSIKLTFVFCALLGVCYVFVLWIFAQFAGPDKGNAPTATLHGKVVGVANVGQMFKKDIYFWGRPSCAGKGYDGTSSGGSNKAMTNKEYLTEVERRITDFLRHHPYLKRKDIPSEMVTASGSGLDPDISPQSAYIQVRRIAIARKCNEKVVRSIVDHHIQKPLFELFGPEKVNVLELNIALDNIKTEKQNV